MSTGGTAGWFIGVVFVVLGPVTARLPLSFLIVHNKKTTLPQKKASQSAIFKGFTTTPSWKYEL
jgi:hypothetical protein